MLMNNHLISVRQGDLFSAINNNAFIESILNQLGNNRIICAKK